MAPWQSLCKALKILKICSCRDAKSSQAKPSSQPVNLPGAWPLMKPLYSKHFMHYTLSYLLVGPREAHKPNLDSDQQIAYYACVPRL